MGLPRVEHLRPEISRQTDRQTETLSQSRGAVQAGAGVTWAALNGPAPSFPHGHILSLSTSTGFHLLGPSPKSRGGARVGGSVPFPCALNQSGGWRDEDTPPLRCVPSAGGGDSGGEKAGSWTAEIKALSAAGRARGRARTGLPASKQLATCISWN